MKMRSILKAVISFVQGAIVGVGAILPGVSGGVLCVAFGIYEPMMELLTSPIKSLKKHYKMFIPFLAGGAIGFVLLAKVVELIFEASAAIALMLFFGLICGTLPELFKVSEQSDHKKSWTPFIVSLSLAYLFLHVLEGGVSTVIAPSFLSYLFCGLLWGLSLIIPGLSSSSVLIYLGLYEPMTAGIGALDFSVILPVFLGIGVTALLFARLVNMLFKKHYALISRIVLGFVIASSLKIVPSAFDNILTLVLSVACFVVGFLIARGMDIAKKKQDASPEQCTSAPAEVPEEPSAPDAE
ncbi:MAG: DUF368 domain-containing protein [Clostridia bacterium]|nr:DUF368 domain-containing protein [Clostridia bacterium]